LELDQDSIVIRKQDKGDQMMKKRKTKVEKSKLSFGDEEEEAEEEEDEVNNHQKKHKIIKNPFVETGFLPDKEREENERKAREHLAFEWMKKQDDLKKESLIITYSFCDGSGQRKTTKITKGTSCARFLEKVRQDCKEFRTVSVDNLLFVKDDIIVPHHIIFYDLHLAKAKGKTGDLLFNFDDTPSPPLKPNEIPKDVPRHTKVVERKWFDMNKHIFPACKWELYEPTRIETRRL